MAVKLKGHKPKRFDPMNYEDVTDNKPYIPPSKPRLKKGSSPKLTIVTVSYGDINGYRLRKRRRIRRIRLNRRRFIKLVKAGVLQPEDEIRVARKLHIQIKNPRKRLKEVM